MIDHYELMKDRLTDNYYKGDDSDVMKLIKLMADRGNDNERSYELMRLSQDVDYAAGGALDVIGRNVGILRGSMVDDLFRRMIKIQIIANLSNGDIPTLNRIYKAYLGDQFKGIQEGHKSIYEEPAALVLKVGNKVDLVQFDTLDKVVAGGVKLYIEATMAGEIIRVIGYSYHYELPLPITNRFRTAGKPGKLIKGVVGIEGSGYKFDVPYPACNRFRAGERKGIR